MSLIAAPPDTFALFTKPMGDDTPLQMWQLETVVAFDSADGGAYIIGGLNRTGKIVRLDETIAEYNFKLAGVWEQQTGGREAALEWASGHIKLIYEDAMPFDPDDPRRSPNSGG